VSPSGTVVVIGSGQAGFQVAASLRDEGFAGRVVVVGEEPGLPYQRPPLSKAFLTGRADEAALRLRADAFYADHGIELRVSERAVAIDRERRAVEFAGGDRLGYDHLVLATGARNRLLPVPGTTLEGVVQLRTLADAEAIRPRLSALSRVVVIGAGFIGLEFAAVAASLGIAVTVLEATGRPMARAISLPMSRFFAHAHEKAGVQLEFGATVTRIDREGDRVAAVETADGRRFAADLVLVAIGVVPNVELAAEAGLPVANGIVVDAQLRTSDPAVSAIGDCALFPCVFAGGAPSRLESVQNAVDGARCVAARIAGRPRPYAAVPWFWSDQGPLKLQIAGLAVAHGDAVLRGDPESGAFSVFCYEDDRLTAVESVNKPGDHVLARKLIGRGLGVAREEAADLRFDLKARANALLAAA
jgi:3-phenylpropionate/trans-cinnamate dioxygenase ferredoxin reductase subunit